MANGFLASGVERDVHAAVVGPHDGAQVGVEFLAFVAAQIGIVVYQLFDLLRSEVVFIAEGSGFDVGCGNSVLGEESSGALHAAFGEFLIVGGRAAMIGVALKYKMRFRFEGQIAIEIGAECEQGVFLAFDQAE